MAFRNTIGAFVIALTAAILVWNIDFEDDKSPYTGAQFQHMVEQSVDAVEESEARKAEESKQDLPQSKATEQSMATILKDHAIQPLPTEQEIRDLPPCKAEDSDNCFWDASTRGNGRGQSFYIVDGIRTPVGPCIRCP